MNLAAPTHAAVSALGRRIRVMIVDYAVVVRGLFSRWIEAESDLEVVASLRSGRDAVDQVERIAPDVVVLDVNMPELDGIAALPLLLEKKRDLIEKIRHLGARAKRFYSAPVRNIDTLPAKSSPPLQPRLPTHDHGPIVLRAMPSSPPRVLLIGSSTGGPQALNAIIGHIASVIEHAPVLITQHMPPTFTAILAEHLARVAKCPVREGQDGEEIHAGTIYIAPGGKHMTVERRDGIAVIAIDDGPMVNFCKPAVDPLFASAATVWGAKALALVLTGMGSDGLNGAKALVAAGGAVIAQDEATSVVWGMPGQVALAGLCSAVLPVNDIAPRLTRLFAGDRV